MGNAITSRQIKAARALLDWTQEDFARVSGLSVATVRKLELGNIPRHSTSDIIRKTFEKSGIEFLDSEGVRLREEGIATFQGANGYDAFFDDIVQTARKYGGEVMIVSTSASGLENIVGLHALRALDDLIARYKDIAVKVIVTDTSDLPISTPRLEYRSLSTNYVDPMSFVVYGDKFAVVASSASQSAKIIVVNSTAAAQSSRRQFRSMWEKSVSPAVCFGEGLLGEHHTSLRLLHRTGSM